MRIFVAGASGAIGQRLIPLLVRAGHTVTGTARSQQKAESIRGAGALPAVVDALDATAVMTAVEQARPELIVHQLTAIPANLNVRRIDRDFALTNRLRTEGLDHLLAAARHVGCTRIVAQSYTGWPYAHTGDAVKSEDAPLDPQPPAAMRAMLEAIRYLEGTVTQTPGIEGTVLRYGAFYGPGNAIGQGGLLVEEVRKRRFPVVGDGGGVWSFAHIDDAAGATAAAIERSALGIYNICDDDPAPVREWLPFLANALGAPAPRHVPAWLARFLIGKHGVGMMTTIRGASNAKAKRELGWTPTWASWRQGFVHAL